jgi:hypothetical protein
VPGGSPGSELLVSLGPTLLVDIGFDASYNPSLPRILPVPGIRGMQALVDTGAAESCIDRFCAIHHDLRRTHRHGDSLFRLDFAIGLRLELPFRQSAVA